MMMFYRFLIGCILACLVVVGYAFIPVSVQAAACTGSCVPSASTCPSSFPIEEAASTCPTAGTKCCAKDSLSSGGGSSNVKTCDKAPGGGICVAEGAACPTGKPTIDNSYICPSLSTKNCCIPASGGSGGAGVGSPTKLNDPLGGAGLYGVLKRVISGVLGIIGAIALLVFFASGVMYMVGGEEYVSTAKSAMVNALIGLLIIFFAYSIANWFFLALTTNPL